MEENLRDFLQQYDLFYMNKSLKNTHVDIGPIRLYTRKSKRFINGNMVSMLDIGSITIDEEYQNKGYFTAIIDRLLKKYPTENFFIESIVNDNVRKVGMKFGFIIKHQSGAPEMGYDMYLLR